MGQRLVTEQVYVHSKVWLIPRLDLKVSRSTSTQRCGSYLGLISRCTSKYCWVNYCVYVSMDTVLSCAGQWLALLTTRIDIF